MIIQTGLLGFEPPHMVPATMEWRQKRARMPAGEARPVWTIGTYDGIHLGHQTIIKKVVERAAALHVPAAVLCFDPPAWKVLGRGRYPYLVTSIEDRRELLAALGVDRVLCLPFTPELLSMTPEQFVHDLVLGELGPSELWIGHDFRYGFGRQGDADSLRVALVEHDVAVHRVEAICVGDIIASASEVRARVCEGDMRGATEILGRPHFIRGAIIHGEGRGASIGFPTANLAPITELLPPAGVYRSTMEVLDGRYMEGMTNIGFRPTFDNKELAVETHLFDVEQDLYGCLVRLHLHERIRDERRFPSVEALVAQIKADVDGARLARPFPAVGPGSW